jgi:hypothetical protein
MSRRGGADNDKRKRIVNRTMAGDKESREQTIELVVDGIADGG